MPNASSQCKPIDPRYKKQLQRDANEKVHRPGCVTAKINPLERGIDIGGKDQEQESANRQADIPGKRCDENGDSGKQLENPCCVDQCQPHGHPTRKHLRHGGGFDKMAETCKCEDERYAGSPT